jgi:hypothetical protein
MNASVQTVLKLIEKHTREKGNTHDMTQASSAQVKSAIEVVLKQIEVRASHSASIREMADQVRQAIK